jgi:hypothetical protein
MRDCRVQRIEAIVERQERASDAVHPWLLILGTELLPASTPDTAAPPQPTRIHGLSRHSTLLRGQKDVGAGRFLRRRSQRTTSSSATSTTSSTHRPPKAVRFGSRDRASRGIGHPAPVYWTVNFLLQRRHGCRLDNPDNSAEPCLSAPRTLAVGTFSLTVVRIASARSQST